MLYITFMSLKSFFPIFIFFIFFEIFQRVYLNCIHCVYVQTESFLLHIREIRETVHGCPYPLVVIRREISVRNSC